VRLFFAAYLRYLHTPKIFSASILTKSALSVVNSTIFFIFAVKNLYDKSDI